MQVLSAKYVVPMEKEETILIDHSVVVDDGKIVEILPTSEANTKYASVSLENRWMGSNSVLLPGFVNAHTHASMTLLRGIADDKALMPWLQNHVWPAEGKFVGPEFVYDGAQLAMAEMLRGGTTTMNDMYFFPDQVAKAADEVGMRVVVGLIAIGFPSAYAGKPDQDMDTNVREYLDKGKGIHSEIVAKYPLVTTVIAPHAPYTVGTGGLKIVKEVADELAVPVHIHLHETAFECEEWEKHNSERPIQTLNKLGLLNDKLLAVHYTQATDEEIKLLADTKTNVIHCPESNMKLASGICPISKLVASGVNVAVGTDGTASNNDLDMFGEIRSAAFLAKVSSGDAEVIPASKALYMATMGGAKALGLDKVCGSLTPGKAADIQAVQFDELETSPMFSCTSHLVYCTGRQQVTDVWVAGKQLLKARKLTTLDESKLLAKAKGWGEKISAAAST